MKYILSLKHTGKKDAFFTLWRPKNAGYCYSLNEAGLYENPEKGYHDSDDNMPVDSEAAERMGSTITYDGQLKTMIPQNSYTLKELGLKHTRKGLVRL